MLSINTKVNDIDSRTDYKELKVGTDFSYILEGLLYGKQFGKTIEFKGHTPYLDKVTSSTQIFTIYNESLKFSGRQVYSVCPISDGANMIGFGLITMRNTGKVTVDYMTCSGFVMVNIVYLL